VPGPTGDIDPPLFVGALRFRGNGFRVWAGTNEAELDGGGGGTPTWAETLAEDFRSGANNPHIDEGQYLSFHNEDALPTAGDIRSSAGLEIEAVGDVLIHTPFNIVLSGHSGPADSVQLNADFFRVTTGATERLEILADGTWEVGGAGGTSGQYLRSLGVGSPPSWQTITFGEITGGTWADVLARGNNSGAFNPHIDDGQFLSFGVEGSIPGSGDIRSSDAFTINVTGAAALVGSTTASITGGGSNGFAASAAAVILGAGTSGITVTNNTFIRLSTGGTERLEIEATGAWQLGGLVGTAGQYMRSAGAGASPAWATITFAEITGGTWSDALAKGATSGANNPSIDSGQRLIFAGTSSPAQGDIDSAGTFTIDAVTSIRLVTNAVERLEIEAAGAWQIGGSVGTAGQYPRSAGAGAPPSWATIAFGEISGGTWSDVLAKGATSGANSPSINSGQKIIFAGGGAAGGDIDAAGVFVIDAVTSVGFTTAGVSRLVIEADGSWNIGGSNGTAGQYARSFGGAAPPQWATIAVADVSGIVATTGAVTIPAGGGASLFSGIRVNGSATTDRTNLNFLNSLHINAAALDDAGSDEIELSFTLDLTDNYVWTGAHEFDSFIQFGGNTGLPVSGDIRKGSGANLEINSALVTNLFSGTGTLITSSSGNIVITAGSVGAGQATLTSPTGVNVTSAGFVEVATSGTARIRYEADGSWNIGGSNGTAGQIIRCFGAAAPPQWVDHVTTQSTSGNHNTDATDIDFSGSDAQICILYCTSTSNIGAVAGGFDGRILLIVGATSSSVTLSHAAASTTVSSQLFLPDGRNVSCPRSGAIFVHDGTTWRAAGVATVGCVARRTTITTVTNATTAIVAATYTIPANTVQQGDVYRMRCTYQYARGATATASNLTVQMRVNGGAQISTGGLATRTVNPSSGVVHMEVDMEFLGAPDATTEYALAARIQETVPSTTVAHQLPVPNLALTVDATAAITLDFSAALSVAVANLSLTCVEGTIEKL
jgi:hypothetical protein